MSWDREQEKKAGKAYHMGFAVFGLAFAVFWCVVAATMGAGIMLLFGIPFVGLMAFRLVMISKHTEPNSKPQVGKEADPRDRPQQTSQAGQQKNGFCPYCGSSVEESFVYCPKCGRHLQ